MDSQEELFPKNRIAELRIPSNENKSSLKEKELKTKLNEILPSREWTVTWETDSISQNRWNDNLP